MKSSISKPPLIAKWREKVSCAGSFLALLKSIGAEDGDVSSPKGTLRSIRHRVRVLSCGRTPLDRLTEQLPIVLDAHNLKVVAVKSSA